MFSVRDLLRLHDMCAPQLPIVFDFHHWRFCTGAEPAQMQSCGHCLCMSVNVPPCSASCHNSNFVCMPCVIADLFIAGDMTSEEALRAAVGTWPKGVRPIVHWSESQGGKVAHAHSVSACPRCICRRCCCACSARKHAALGIFALCRRAPHCGPRYGARLRRSVVVSMPPIRQCDGALVQDYVGQQGRLNLHGMDAELDVMIESKAKELSILLYRCKFSMACLLQSHIHILQCVTLIHTFNC